MMYSGEAWGAIDHLTRSQQPASWHDLRCVAEAAEVLLEVEVAGESGFRLVSARSGAGIEPGVEIKVS
jgi:hypothetical protein